MARILILSSMVGYGHVGLSAATPALQALGHEVTALPTTVLSNHPGWPHVAGQPVEPAQIKLMIDALAANGWLSAHDAMLTGYLPSTEHVAAAGYAITRLRAVAPHVRIVVDPVIGDVPKGRYIDEAAAEALRDRLLPLADILTPNAFELAWLTGQPVDTLPAARRAAADLAARGMRLLVTSPPVQGDKTGVLSVAGRDVRLFVQPRLDYVPHGVGDVYAAFIAAGIEAGQAVGHLRALIAQSVGRGHLDIVAGAPEWKAAPPLPGIDLAEEA